MRTFRVSTSPDGPVVASFPLNLSAAPKHAESLGHMVAAFAALEFTLFQLYHQLLVADINMARVNFFGLTAWRTKSEMTLALARVRFKHNRDIKDLEELLGKINKTANKRNQYIHDLWCTDKDGDACQFRWGTKAKSIEASKIKRQDVDQLTAQIVLWADKLDEFMTKHREWA